jgi:hypothetical protein
MKCSLILVVVICLGLTAVASAAGTSTQSVRMRVDKACILGIKAESEDSQARAGVGDVTSKTGRCMLTRAHYTSVVSPADSRTITASWDGSDTALPGCSLRLEVAELALGCGATVPGGIRLSRTAQSIVTDIGSCATGTPQASDPRLIYTLGIDDPDGTRTGHRSAVTVTLTITDAS